MLYHLRLQPSEIDRMPYWRLHYIVENLTDILKKKQESESGEQDKYSTESMQGNAQKQLAKHSKAPKLPGFSAPKFPTMPSIKL